MKETKAKIGYDPDAKTFYIGFKPTLDLKDSKIATTDAKVLFNLKDSDIHDIRLLLKNVPEEIEQLGDDPVACPVCATLTGLKDRFRRVFEANSGKLETKKDRTLELLYILSLLD